MIKRKISIFLISVIVAAAYCYIKAEPGTELFGYTIKSSDMEQIQQGLSEKIMRFHVVANSDSARDQELKLKVKEAVVSYISPVLKESEDINRSKEILAENRKKFWQLHNRLSGTTALTIRLRLDLNIHIFLQKVTAAIHSRRENTKPL